MDDHAAQVLADLEQELLAPAVRRLRRRFWTTTALVAAAAVVGLATLGLAALPLLSAGLVTGALVLVARAEGTATPPVEARARERQPLGCSTKS